MKKSAAVLLILIFAALISAPTIILSIDNSIDTSVLLGLSEEEEIEDAKLLFDIKYSNDLSFEKDYPLNDAVYYAYKEYPRPHLNLISPPPEGIFY